MASSLNKVTLIGFVGKDPEIRMLPSTSRSVASFSLATSVSWRDKASGELKSRTEWHNIVVWNEHLVSLVQRKVKKGAKLYIEGELCYRKWQDKNTGANHIAAEVVLQNFDGQIILLDKQDGGDSYSSSDISTENNSVPDMESMVDDIPF